MNIVETLQKRLPGEWVRVERIKTSWPDWEHAFEHKLTGIRVGVRSNEVTSGYMYAWECDDMLMSYYGSEFDETAESYRLMEEEEAFNDLIDRCLSHALSSIADVAMVQARVTIMQSYAKLW